MWTIFVFSMAVNALMLTAPLYMLQVYDRVLGSRSEETLLALSILVLFLMTMMGVLDYLRGRVSARVGAQLQDGLDARVFSAELKRARQSGQTQTGLQDLEAVQRLMASPVFLSLFDLPWTPLFLAAIFVFHPWLGWLALSGGGVLIALALLNQRRNRAPLREAAAAARTAEITALGLQNEAELVRSLGMQSSVFARWRQERKASLALAMQASDGVGGYTTATKTLRMVLQSAMLGLGAYLVLQNQLTAGAMIAASILLGRALAPIEQVIGQWAAVDRARAGWSGLVELLEAVPEEAPRLPLPRPSAALNVHQLSLVPPGDTTPVLRGVSFALRPGEAVGVIGSSGAGKSSLARAVIGVWPPSGGQIRLDHASLDQFDGDVLGRLIGYLPQRVALFPGTIAENIARLDPGADPEAIVAAAKRADAHEMILRQPLGYDTPTAGPQARLSGGQIQRVGLARALYGDPVLLVLDEPNANLDHDGSQALNRAVRDMTASGGAALIMAHRPAAIEVCDKLLMLEGGQVRMFGPREEVLRKTVLNHADLQSTQAMPGRVAVDEKPWAEVAS
ncbi:MAG: type I secretion system permease/ATPase [Pseudomonadota bacterium]